ncbi:MAG: DMT family transporter [Hyphomicrobiales bacterium]|nr:DMT family transporter [Hyphomicrobiales bacterium]MCP5370428.1 DMT family transporter [Hyphomicrobiales bacterium]
MTQPATGTPPSANLRPDRPLPGILLMAAAMGVLSLMDAVVKGLVTGGAQVPQILAVRGWVILAALVLWLPRMGGAEVLRTRRPWAITGRTLVACAAPGLFFLSLRDLPLAEATAITFGSVFMVAALSAPLLKEHVGPHRWAAIAVGFLGVLWVTRPGTAAFQPAALLALGAGLCFALMSVSSRWLGGTEPTFRLVFYFNLGTALVYSVMAPFVWQPLSAGELAAIGLVAALALFGHLAVTRAFVIAPVGAVAPMEYTSLVWAALFGYLGFGTLPGVHVIVGSAVIVASGLFLVHRERVARRRGKG